jgi:hypothetical protein
MAILSQPAFGPRVALAYVTGGTLLDVWTAVWFFAFARGQPITNLTWFWLVGLFLTGVTLIVIGLLLGPIGQAARRAELPPADAVNAEAQIQQSAAAAQHPVVMTPPAAVPAPHAVVPPPVPAPPLPAPAPRTTTPAGH